MYSFSCENTSAFPFAFTFATGKCSKCFDYSLESDLPLTVSGTVPQYLSEREILQGSLMASCGVLTFKVYSIWQDKQSIMSFITKT